MITITVDATRAIAQLRQAQSILENNLQDGLLVAGAGVQTLLQGYYSAKNAAEPNRLGGKRTHFWDTVGRSVSVPRRNGSTEVVVGITDKRIAQKVHGGTIRAKRVKFLTIPIHPEAHGHRAATLADGLGVRLFVRKDKDSGRAFLSANWSGRLTDFYVLKRSVTQKPWHGALPEQHKIEMVVEVEFNAWLNEQLRRLQ